MDQLDMMFRTHPHIDQLGARYPALATRNVVGCDCEGLQFCVRWIFSPRENVLTTALVRVVVAVVGLVMGVT